MLWEDTTIRRVVAWAWPVARVLAALAVTIAVYWADQRATQADVRRDLDRHAERIQALEETDKTQARAERAEGEWRGRMVERMDALINRLDRIERKIDGGTK